MKYGIVLDAIIIGVSVPKISLWPILFIVIPPIVEININTIDMLRNVSNFIQYPAQSDSVVNKNYNDSPIPSPNIHAIYLMKILPFGTLPNGNNAEIELSDYKVPKFRKY